MSDEIALQAALEKALKAVAPPIVTILGDNEDDDPDLGKPQDGEPYQRVSVQLAQPDDREWGGNFVQSGLVEVVLLYPRGQGDGPSLARARLLRAAFPKGRSIPAGAATITITGTPEITPGRPSEDRYARNVRIRFHAPMTA